MSEPTNSPHMQLAQTTTSDYGAGAGKGGEVLGIGVPELKLAAPVFGTQSKKLSTALTTLITKLDGLGKPWGTDGNIEEEFEKPYLQARKSVESTAGILVLGLVSIHEALDDMKDGHVDNEDLIKGMFTRVAAEGGKGDGADGGEDE